MTRFHKWVYNQDTIVCQKILKHEAQKKKPAEKSNIYHSQQQKQRQAHS